MPRPEQLALDLHLERRTGLLRRLLPRLWRSGAPHPWCCTLARLVAQLLGALALACVAVQLVPYRSTVAGVAIEVSGSVTPAHRGLTVDSSVGDLQFRSVTALPLGLHVTPRVDLATVRAATTGGFSERVRAELQQRVPGLLVRFGAAALAGLLVGAVAGGLLLDGAVLLLAADPYPAGGSRRRRAASAGLQALGLTLATVAVLAGWTAATYRTSWYTRYTVTGLLADVAATPARLAALDARDTGAADKVRAVLRLQDALTQPAREREEPDTAFSVLLVSDVHRRNIYPYLQQYIDANDVALIVNTGDETLTGNAAELTPDYLASIRALTSRTPMVWIKGNHDSTAVAEVMDALPGVTVLDGQVLPAYGLQLYGTADPRTYGAAGDLGADDPATVTRVETTAAAEALSGIARQTYLDLLLAHEPVEADALSAALGASVRAQASGHLHRQNAERDLQSRPRRGIRLVEGSTGLGGLLADGSDPMEFSVLSVSRTCQFTRVARYQLADPALPDRSGATSFGADSSFVVHYFAAQPLARRTCSTAFGIDDPLPATSTLPRTVADWGGAGTPLPSPGPVATPSPVSSADEQGDRAVTTPAPSTPAPSAPAPTPRASLGTLGERGR